MRQSRTSLFAVAGFASLVLCLGACGGNVSGEPATAEPSAVSEAASGSAVATADPVQTDDPVASESPAGEDAGFTELQFGQTLSTSNEDGSQSSDITVGKPRVASCQYQSIGCDKPEIGDRVVTIPLLIENTGTSAAEWSQSYFLLEFADGTQVEAGDGSTFDYQPDNSLGYDAKVRVGGKLKTSLTFEAPKGPFSVLILTNTYDGEPFASWS